VKVAPAWPYNGGMPIPVAIAALALTTMQVDAPTAEGWHRVAREVVDDRLVYSLALERAGVGAEDASVLYGSQYSYLNRYGDIRDRAGIGWTRLSGESVLMPIQNSGDTRRLRCDTLAGHDPIPGERTLVALPGRPRLSGTRPESTGGPEVVLATTGNRPQGDLQELAIVVVEAGESVQVTTIHDRRTGDREELIEFGRPDTQQALVFYRDGSSVTACFQGTPPEARDELREQLKRRLKGQADE